MYYYRTGITVVIYSTGICDRHMYCCGDQDWNLWQYCYGDRTGICDSIAVVIGLECITIHDLANVCLIYIYSNKVPTIHEMHVNTSLQIVLTSYQNKLYHTKQTRWFQSFNNYHLLTLSYQPPVCLYNKYSIIASVCYNNWSRSDWNTWTTHRIPPVNTC